MTNGDYDNLTDEQLREELGKRSQPVTGDRDTDLQRLRVTLGDSAWDDDQYAKGEQEATWDKDSFENRPSATAQPDTAEFQAHDADYDPRTDPNSSEYDPDYDPNRE